MRFTSFALNSRSIRGHLEQQQREKKNEFGDLRLQGEGKVREVKLLNGDYAIPPLSGDGAR